MAVQPTRNLISLFGWVIWGDFADMTTYRRPDGRVVTFAKTYPDKPPSAAQLDQRQKIIDAAAAWKALTAPQRDQWHQAARRASLCMHGYSLYVAATVDPDPGAVATLARQTSTTLDMS